MSVSSPTPSQRPELTASRAEISQMLQSRIQHGKSIRGRSADEINGWIAANQSILRDIFTNDEKFDDYIKNKTPYASDNLPRLINTFESIRDRLALFSEPGAQEISMTAGPKLRDPSVPEPRGLSKVFVVHGHDGEPKAEVARFIEKLGFQAVILHELPNRGRTIITKFREEAADAGFAVILMTPDDHGGIAGQDTRPRARQNVIFELGFFIGALGPDRVAALVKGDVERPSDFEGVGYTELDSRGAWKQELGQELQAAGFKIDWNKFMAG